MTKGQKQKSSELCVAESQPAEPRLAFEKAGGENFKGINQKFFVLSQRYDKKERVGGVWASETEP